MSYDSFLFAHCVDEKAAMQYLRQHNVLRRAPTCLEPGCNWAMTEIKDRTMYFWRCPRHKNRRISCKDGSYWSSSHIPIRKHLMLLYNWAHQIPRDKTATMVGVDEKTVTQWYQYYRDVCSHWLVANPYMLGGVGRIVQVDESQVSKRKNNVGRPTDGVWVFGGYQTDIHRGFFEIVEDRSADTLLPLVRKYITPGTTIHSDHWRSYQQVANIPVNPRYRHGRVNHSQNFVDPATGVHTQAVESYWGRMKRRLKSLNGISRDNLPSYLDEWLWFDQHGRQGHQRTIENLLLHLAQWRPVP